MSEQLNGITTIIFDLGMVVIDLHYERAANQFSEISGVNELKEFLISSDTLKEFEVGGISDDVFRTRVCDELGIRLSADQFDAKWNYMLGEISSKRIDKMLELKTQFKTLVLSNTNSIHVRSFNQSLKEAHGYEGVHKLVDKAYYSQELGMRKPNADIYEFVLSDQDLKPNEVLFIDDREDNIAAANLLGIKTYLNENVDDWIQIMP